MLKILFLIFYVCVFSSCEMPAKLTTKEEYVEEYEWDRERGFVKNEKVSWAIHWGS